MAVPWAKIVERSAGHFDEASKQENFGGQVAAMFLPKEGMGFVKNKQAKKKAEEAKAATPGMQDPTQVQRLAEIDQIAKNIQAGTDSATQTGLGQIQGQTAQTQNRLARVTGGNIGATVDALLKAQRAGADASNQAIAQGQQRLPFFKGLSQDLANRIEQRAFDLGMLNRGQSLAEAAQAQKENAINQNSAKASGSNTSDMTSLVEGSNGRLKSLFSGMKLNNQAEGGVGNIMGGMGSSFMPNQQSGMQIDPQFANNLPLDNSTIMGGAEFSPNNISSIAGLF